MNLDAINKWLTLIANFGVIVGIVFLAIEVQQNTRIAERDARLTSSEALYRTMLENERLPGLMDRIQQVQGEPPPVTRLAEAFSLTGEEANLWFRYQLLFWRQMEADWILFGRDLEACEFQRQLYQSLDNQIFISTYGQARMDREFYACVTQSIN